MGTLRPARILLLCDDRRGHANTVLDHIDAFRLLSRHRVATFNPVAMRGSLALDLAQFDAVVVHYSLILSNDLYLSPGFREKLQRFKGLKLQFIQDEYRWVDRATAVMREVGIDVLFTCAPEPAAGQLYDARLPGVTRVMTLTGYVPASLRDRTRRPLPGRPLDVGYRGRTIPFWLGRLTQEKAWIGQGFRERAPRYGLKVDIGWSEEDRIYGDRWIDFISSCRATLATESGASIADFDGTVEQKVRDYLRSHPGASFDETHVDVLAPYEGNVTVNVISPRMFEAAALGTALVMFPGEYSGIVAPGEHYIVLEKDFSNMAAVAAQLKDEAGMAALVERTHRHLIASDRWSYAAFIEQFDAVVSDRLGAAPRAGGSARFRMAQVERILRVPPVHVRLARPAMRLVSMATGRRWAEGAESRLGSTVTKGFYAWRITMADPALRRIYREGRRDGMPRRGLLDELLKLHLVRLAASGRLASVDTFSVSVAFDPVRGALRFISTRDGVEADGESSPEMPTEAQLAGSLKVIEWDHSQLGNSVRLTKPRIEVGVGQDGRKSFPLVADIVRRRPELLGEALTLAIRPARMPAGRLV
jgi:hypothetical protein